MDEFMAALMREAGGPPTDRRRNALLRSWTAAEPALATEK